MKYVLAGMIGAAFCLAPLSLAGPQAQPSDYPNRTVKVIVPYPAGGSLDAVARILSARLSETLKQQFIVENRAGASGTIGTNAVARSEPDGYTLLVVVDSHAINPSLFKSLPYDTEKDLQPVLFVGRSPLVLSVSASVPATNLAEFVRLATEQPGTLTFGSVGLGSQPHLAGEMFKRHAKVDLLHVPYRGGGPAMNDLVAGHLNSIFITPVAGLQHYKAGTVRPVGVAAKTRVPLLPDVPTMTEAGYPFLSEYWYGVLAPAGTPPDVTAKLEAALNEALAAPTVRLRLMDMGLEIEPLGPEAFRQFLHTQSKIWSEFIKGSKIQVE